MTFDGWDLDFHLLKTIRRVFKGLYLAYPDRVPQVDFDFEFLIHLLIDDSEEHLNV